MKPLKRFAITIGIDLAEIDRVNTALAEFADAQGLPAKVRRTMRVVLDELLSNAISYGFRGRAGGEIAVEGALAHDRLAVTITDNGRPFNPLAMDSPDTLLTTQERRLGGLGIHIVRKAVTEVSYERVADRNVVRLTLTVADA